MLKTYEGYEPLCVKRRVSHLGLGRSFLLQGNHCIIINYTGSADPSQHLRQPSLPTGREELLLCSDIWLTAVLTAETGAERPSAGIGDAAEPHAPLLDRGRGSG